MRRMYMAVDLAQEGGDFGCTTTYWLGRDGRIHVLKSTTEEPKMNMLEALALYTTKSDVSGKPARAALLRQAQKIVNDEKTRLYQEADKKAEIGRVLADVLVLHSVKDDDIWCIVKRVFSDGKFTLATEKRAVAEQIQYAFEQGKKAANIQYCPDPRAL